MNLYLRTPSFSRRRSARIETVDMAGSLLVYWRCHKLDDISLVRDLSSGGMFIETSLPRSVGAAVTIDFLVPEGQIRADAVVCHAQPDGGLGLKFTAMPEKDRPRMGMLMSRLRKSSQIRAASCNPWNGH